MIPPTRQLHSEQESVLTFTQQSPPSQLQSALLVSSLQKALLTNVALSQPEQQKHSVQYCGFTFDPQQSPPSKLHSAILSSSSQLPVPIFQGLVVSQPVQVEITLNGNIVHQGSRNHSLLHSIIQRSSSQDKLTYHVLLVSLPTLISKTVYSPVHKYLPKTSFYYINCNLDTYVGTMNKFALVMQNTKFAKLFNI